MEQTLKKYAIIITIAILFFFFTFSVIEAIKERPTYSDYCTRTPRPMMTQSPETDCEPYTPPKSLQEDCLDRGGQLDYEYNQSGCQIDATCNMCSAEYDDAQEAYQRMSFLIGSFIGLIAVIFGIYYTTSNEIFQWINAGILVGGMAVIFVATARYYSFMPRFLKPIVLFIEIVLVSWVAIATFSRTRKKSHTTKTRRSKKQQKK